MKCRQLFGLCLLHQTRFVVFNSEQIAHHDGGAGLALGRRQGGSVIALGVYERIQALDDRSACTQTSSGVAASNSANATDGTSVL